MAKHETSYKLDEASTSIRPGKPLCQPASQGDPHNLHAAEHVPPYHMSRMTCGQIVVEYGTPMPVGPAPEWGLRSSYGRPRQPGLLRILFTGLLLRSVMSVSSLFIAATNLLRAVSAFGSCAASRADQLQLTLMQHHACIITSHCHFWCASCSQDCCCTC